jgi:hypothetical protein
MTGKPFKKRTGGRGSGTSTNTNSPEKKEAVMEFTPHIAGKHQAVTYETVKEHIMQELQIELKHGYDIVKCLRAGLRGGIPITKPIRIIEKKGNHSDETLKVIQDGHDMEWKIDRNEFSVRKNIYEENVYKTYAIIFGYCNKTMQSRIEET